MIGRDLWLPKVHKQWKTIKCEREHVYQAEINISTERDEITKEENEKNIHLKSLSSDRAGSGFPNWLQSWGYFAHFIIAVRSEENQFSANAPDQIKKKKSKNKITKLHSTIILLHSPRRLLQPQLCASLHFKLVSVSSFHRFSYARLYAIFSTSSSSSSDCKAAKRFFRKKNVQAELWFSSSF